MSIPCNLHDLSQFLRFLATSGRGEGAKTVCQMCEVRGCMMGAGKSGHNPSVLTVWSVLYGQPSLGCAELCLLTLDDAGCRTLLDYCVMFPSRMPACWVLFGAGGKPPSASAQHVPRVLQRLLSPAAGVGAAAGRRPRGAHVGGVVGKGVVCPRAAAWCAPCPPPLLAHVRMISRVRSLGDPLRRAASLGPIL
jgi:hypothetical protein